MLPKVALIFYITFVIFLLRLERKQAPEVSLALWIPTIWMIVIASKPLGIWFQAGSGDMEAGSSLDQIFLLAIFGVGTIILFKRRFNWQKGIRENSWVILLICYMLISISWSEVQFVSFKRWIRELIALIMAFLLLTETDPRAALQAVFRRTIYILIPLSYILINYFPTLGRMYGRWSGVQMWVGAALQKNGLGRFCAFTALFLVWTLIRRWKGKDIAVASYQVHIEIAILLLALWLLAGPQHTFSYSAASTGALAISLLCLFGFLWLKKQGKILDASVCITACAILIIYGTITPFAGGLTLIDISSVFGREETLTGRSEIWETLTPFAINQPILGYGIGGFWTSEMVEIALVNTSHNGYLEIVLSLGFIGLMMISMFVISSMKKAQREVIQDFYWGTLWICFLLIALTHNIAESSLNSFSNHLTAVLLFLSVCISNREKTSE